MLYSIGGGSNDHADARAIHAAALKRMADMLQSSAYDRKDRKGGQLLVAKVHYNQASGLPDYPEILLIESVGEVPNGDALKYTVIAEEKILRLFQHLSDGHCSSWETKDDAKGRYGGSVYSGTDTKLIVAFSGLPEAGDEALCMAALRDTRKTDSHQSLAIMNSHANPYFPVCFPGLYK